MLNHPAADMSIDLSAWTEDDVQHYILDRGDWKNLKQAGFNTESDDEAQKRFQSCSSASKPGTVLMRKESFLKQKGVVLEELEQLQKLSKEKLRKANKAMAGVSNNVDAVTARNEKGA